MIIMWSAVNFGTRGGEEPGPHLLELGTFIFSLSREL
jgi:hypothetical protein